MKTLREVLLRRLSGPVLMLVVPTAALSQTQPQTVLTRDTGSPPAVVPAPPSRAVTTPDGLIARVVDSLPAAPAAAARTATSVVVAPDGLQVLVMPNSVSIPTAAAAISTARTPAVPVGVTERVLADGTRVLQAPPPPTPTLAVNPALHPVVEVDVDTNGKPLLPRPIEPNVIYKLRPATR